MEPLLKTAQNNTIRTKYVNAKIANNTQKNSKLRDETVNHMISNKSK